jgi:ribonuclease HII
LKAIAARYNKADVVIILDGKIIPELPPQFNHFRIIAVPKADENITAVSAASVIAKCSRDRDMITLSETGYYAPYGLEKNMGYLTAEHRKAILEHGATSNHRSKAISQLTTR